LTETESEDGTAAVVCHADQATDTSRNAKQKPTQRVRAQKSVRKVLVSVRKVATGVGKVAAEKVSVGDTSRHTDQETDETTNAKQKSTQHGAVHYMFGNEFSLLQRLFSITNGR
jgi:hypothetical protein